jgi:acyl dehydratase
MIDLVISLMMLATLALAMGAVFLWRRGERKRAGLMAVLAIVIAGNVVIWTTPTENGDTLVGSAAVSD